MTDIDERSSPVRGNMVLVEPTSADQSPSFVDLSDDDVDLKTIRGQCDVLVRSKAVDKEAALQILRIQHAMETLFFNLRHTTSRDLDTLRNELTVTKLTHTNASAINDLGQDSARSKREIKELQELREKQSKEIQEMNARLADMEARLLAALNKRR